MFSVKQPANCVGLKKPKSDYVRYDGHDISWREPFGPGLQVYQALSVVGLHTDDTPRSTLSCATSEYHVTITLRQHHTLRHGQDVGTCLIDCSGLQGRQSQWFYAVKARSS
jgi:hypothetical protein